MFLLVVVGKEAVWWFSVVEHVVHIVRDDQQFVLTCQLNDTPAAI